jgi:hyperosmotically inducible protein
MKTHPKPALVLLAVGAILGAGSAGLAQNVARDIPEDETEMPPPDNATLAASVKDKLLRSPDAPALQIDVKADEGVVTLSGLVAAEVERVSAETIARTTRGVKDVKNRIIVRDRDLAKPGTPDPRGASWDPPRTSPTPVTPGAPALPNGVPTPPPPLPQVQ